MPTGANATTLGTLEGLLPKPIAKKILVNAYKESVIGRLSGTDPMPITGSSIAFQTGKPVAGVVGEGDLKPVVESKPTVKVTKPIKVAATMYWSKEARQANPVAYLTYLQDSAKDAIRRAIDMAVIHGKNALNGNAIAGVEGLVSTASSVELGTTGKTDGGIVGDILAGYKLAVGQDSDFSGFAAAKTFRPDLLSATDTYGRPIFSSANAAGGVDLRNPMGTLLGVPIGFSDAVAGKLGVVADSKVRLIGGDFQEGIVFGYVEQINLRKSDTATIVDGETTVHLFQQNMEAFIVEAQFGWVIRDVNRFVKYTVK